MKQCIQLSASLLPCSNIDIGEETRFLSGSGPEPAKTSELCPPLGGWFSTYGA